MTIKPDTLRKYLETYADPSIDFQRVNSLSQHKRWKQAIAIPARSEFGYIDKTLESIHKSEMAQHGKLLLVLVLNLSTDSSAQDILSHEQTLNFLGVDNSTPTLLEESFSFDLLVLNYNRKNAFDPKDGVGRARKIGGDLLCYLRYKERLEQPYYFSTDSDVQWPNKIESQTFPSSFSALCLSFQHEKSEIPHENQAIQLYDRFLKDYRKGLREAGSAYAFFTLGSNLVIDFLSYAKVRGFPVRNAGEDFYLLNKLAKVGLVLDFPISEPIKLSARSSHRVPFGTGASVAEISKRLLSGLDYKVYDPIVYQELKDCLERLKKLSTDGNWEEFLLEQGRFKGFWLRFETKVLNILKQARTVEQRTKALQDFFDSFLTLKWIHYLTETFYPKLPMIESKSSLEAMRN
ncbi:hypothetical protein GW915_05220 [bacterium]|nr:hypothetical protein [bacterium]